MGEDVIWYFSQTPDPVPFAGSATCNFRYGRLLLLSLCRICLELMKFRHKNIFPNGGKQANKADGGGNYFILCLMWLMRVIIGNWVIFKDRTAYGSTGQAFYWNQRTCDLVCLNDSDKGKNFFRIVVIKMDIRQRREDSSWVFCVKFQKHIPHTPLVISSVSPMT